MPSVNLVILIGNITRDLELRYTTGGTATCDMGLAMNRKFKDANGDVKEEVTFVDVVLWGKTAETVCKWTKKGNPIYIEGRLSQDEWEDKATGQKKRKTRVTCTSFQFLGSKDGGPKQRVESEGGGEELDGDGIPF